jgi:UDP-glucose 4-epimerase
MEKVLVTGIAGGQGRLLARRLRESFDVCGVDRRPWEEAPRGVSVHVVDLRKKQLADVIRSEKPGAVVHLGFLQRFHVDEGLRYDVNVRGTQLLLQHCARQKVPHVVVVSGSYVYGASPENPYDMDELTPLAASRSYPEMRDLVDVDYVATSYPIHEPDLQVCVLRPVNVLGHSAHSMMARYLALRRVPTVMGFDPMLQFIHEEDLAEAISLSLERRLRGVYNVVGPGGAPLHTAIRETGGRPLPLPELLIRPLFTRLFRLGALDVPPGALDYLKYPITLDGSRFRAATQFRPLFGLEEIFHSMGRR